MGYNRSENECLGDKITRLLLHRVVGWQFVLTGERRRRKERKGLTLTGTSNISAATQTGKNTLISAYLPLRSPAGVNMLPSSLHRDAKPAQMLTMQLKILRI